MPYVKVTDKHTGEVIRAKHRLAMKKGSHHELLKHVELMNASGSNHWYELIDNGEDKVQTKFDLEPFEL